MSNKIKVVSISKTKNRITFHRYWVGCSSHKTKRGCRSISYKPRKYWYDRVEILDMETK